MQSVVDSLTSKAQAARMAGREMARLPTAVKNESLRNIAESLHSRRAEILEANAADCEESRRQGLSEAVLDRLRLNEERLASIADDVRRIIELPDPVGEVLEERTLPNGLEVRRRRVPLGVIGAIYESRPNITIDISSLCFKAGNAVVLRGGKEAFSFERGARRRCPRRHLEGRRGRRRPSSSWIHRTVNSWARCSRNDRIHRPDDPKGRRRACQARGRGSSNAGSDRGNRRVPRVCRFGSGRGYGRRSLAQRQGAAAHSMQRPGHAAGPFSRQSEVFYRR